MLNKAAFVVAALVISSTLIAPPQDKSPGAGPVVVLETARGNIEFETYPEEAPKTVARILDLVNKGFYNGLRFDRAEANFLIQVGDPATRDVSREPYHGGAGKPVWGVEGGEK